MNYRTKRAVKMKILVPAIGRINTKNRDGSEIRFSAVAKIWQENGFEVHLVLPPREEKVLKSDGLMAKYYVLPEKTTYEGENLLVIFLIYLVRLAKALLFFPPRTIDLLYIPSDFLIDLIPGLWWKRKLPKAKVIVCLFLIAPNPFKGYRYGFKKGWTFPTPRSILFFLTQRLSIFLLRRFADTILVLNELDRKILEEKGLGGKIAVIDMGVNFNNFQKLKEPVKFYDACFLGRLHPQKGIFDLIKIWKIVCQKSPRAKLAIMAGGSEDVKNIFVKTIESADLSNNIFYLGFKTGEEKARILKRSKVFLLPSFYESWGMVAVEAMAAGLPVVAYDLPVFQEIFLKGIIRVTIGDYQEFAITVLNLLRDETLYQEKVKEAEEQAKEYDWQVVAEREMKFLTRGIR